MPIFTEPTRPEHGKEDENKTQLVNRLSKMEQNLAKAMAELSFTSSEHWPAFVGRMAEMQAEYAMQSVRLAPTDYIAHAKWQGVIEFIDVILTLHESAVRDVNRDTKALQKKGV